MKMEKSKMDKNSSISAVELVEKINHLIDLNKISYDAEFERGAEDLIYRFLYGYWDSRKVGMFPHFAIKDALELASFISSLIFRTNQSIGQRGVECTSVYVEPELMSNKDKFEIENIIILVFSFKNYPEICQHCTPKSIAKNLASGLPAIRNTRMYPVLKELEGELSTAMGLWPKINSAHEGLGLIQEEFKELCDEVYKKQKDRDPDLLKKECIQVATTALRMIFDICNEENIKK